RHDYLNCCKKRYINARITKALSKKIENQTKKSLVWDLTGSLLRQFASVFITIILARLLSPEEFGVIGMALVFANPKLYRILGSIGRKTIKWFPFLVNNKLNPWYKQREMPEPPKESFRDSIIPGEFFCITHLLCHPFGHVKHIGVGIKIFPTLFANWFIAGVKTKMREAVFFKIKCNVEIPFTNSKIVYRCIKVIFVAAAFLQCFLTKISK
ncbi:MAG: DUF3390 domain-containing protein, partial [Chitinophagaceae bacterium]